MHHRIVRFLGAITAAMTLATTMVVSSAVATPAAIYVVGQNLSPDAVSWSNPPATVNLGAFHLLISNTGTSNISQLYLTELSGAWTYGYTVGYTNQVAPAWNCSQPYVAGSSTGSQFMCSLGPLNAGAAVDITVALISPSKGSSWPVDFELSSTGYTLADNKGGKLGNSHGDLWGQSFPTQLATSSSNNAGTYVWDTSQQTLQTDQTISKNHPQSAKATLNGGDTNFPFYLSDGSDATPVSVGCSADTSISIFGNWTKVSALDDKTLGGLLHTNIVIYHGPNANTVNGICWVHKAWNADETAYTWAGTSLLNAPYTTGGSGALCSTDPVVGTDPAIANLGACFTLTNVGPNLQIDFYSFHNGHVGGW